MTSFKNLSIKSKLTWVSMLTSCVALLIACTAFVTYELFRFRQAMVLELSTLADVIGKYSAPSLRTEMPIGAENQMEDLRECSVVLARFDVEGHSSGTVGVLGPTRMNYPQAMAAVAAVSRRLGEHLSPS